jgi:hypothetical protein
MAVRHISMTTRRATTPGASIHKSQEENTMPDLHTEVVTGRLSVIIRNGSGFMHLPDMREVYIAARIIDSIGAEEGDLMRCKVARNGGDGGDRRSAELRCLWAVLLDDNGNVIDGFERRRNRAASKAVFTTARSDGDVSNAMADALRSMKGGLESDGNPSTSQEHAQNPPEKGVTDASDGATATTPAETTENASIHDAVPGQDEVPVSTISTMDRDALILKVVDLIRSGGIWTSKGVQRRMIEDGIATDLDRLRIDSAFSAARQHGHVSHAAVYIDANRARASRIYCAKDTDTLIGAFGTVIERE